MFKIHFFIFLTFTAPLYSSLETLDAGKAKLLSYVRYEEKTDSEYIGFSKIQEDSTVFFIAQICQKERLCQHSPVALYQAYDTAEKTLADPVTAEDFTKHPLFQTAQNILKIQTDIFLERIKNDE